MTTCCPGDKHTKPLSPGCHHFCGMSWKAAILDVQSTFLWRPKGRTHSKFIVWILFSFPEWPWILELLHFIGPVVAGERDSHAIVIAPRKDSPWSGFNKAWGNETFRTPILTHWGLKANSLCGEGWRWHRLILLYNLHLLLRNPLHSSQFNKVYIYGHVCKLICIVLKQFYPSY